MQAVNQKELDQLVSIIHKEVKQIETSGGWEPIADTKIKALKKKSYSNSIITRAETIVNYSYEKVVDFFMQDDYLQKLNDMCIGNRLIHEKKGIYKIFHVQIKTPFPLDNREAVQMVTWINEGNKFYLGTKACNYPIEPNPKFVMAHMNIGGFIMEKHDNNSTKVTSFADLDPRGNIPDFLKNHIAERRIQTLQDLDKTLKKAGY